MKTAIVSDLHLGTTSGSDVVRDPGIRAVLLEELRGADRLVLLGDVIELRERPLGAALDLALPALAEIGAAVGDIEVVLVPGNHDARLAEPLLDELSMAGAPLALDSTADPSPRPASASPTPGSGCATTSTRPTATTWTSTSPCRAPSASPSP
jgi:hypothetical protein